MSIIDDLTKNAEAGRGLWVGLAFKNGWSNDWARFLPENPHLTLVHLGKKNKAVDVNELVSKVYQTAMEIPSTELVAELTGFGILYRWSGNPTPIGLINSSVICKMREVLMNKLGDKCSDAYGFIPHITLDSKKMEEMGHGIHSAWNLLSSGRSSRLTSEGITIFCGDVSINAKDM